MEDLLQQIEDSYKSGYFYLTLFCTLALPDICGAISSVDGIATGTRYKAWFDKYVAPRYQDIFDGGNCYAFRCAALHQGKAEHRNLGYARILFLASATGQHLMHKNILNDALNLDLVEFCKDVLDGVRKWMQDHADSPEYQKNIATLLKRHKNGGNSGFSVGESIRIASAACAVKVLRPLRGAPRGAPWTASSLRQKSWYGS